mmetsp:Transcript_51811/g.66378  ORF Transcript_51811/g.66378 Transcript_51811/m.66378 type:complete len:101 (+) Transcript_51811:949-1251(+)
MVRLALALGVGHLRAVHRQLPQRRHSPPATHDGEAMAGRHGRIPARPGHAQAAIGRGRQAHGRDHQLRTEAGGRLRGASSAQPVASALTLPALRPCAEVA